MFVGLGPEGLGWPPSGRISNPQQEQGCQAQQPLGSGSGQESATEVPRTTGVGHSSFQQTTVPIRPFYTLSFRHITWSLDAQNTNLTSCAT